MSTGPYESRTPGGLGWRGRGGPGWSPHDPECAPADARPGEAAARVARGLTKRRRPAWRTAQDQSGYANTPETRWYYVLYVLKFILYNTAMYYLSVQ